MSVQITDALTIILSSSAFTQLQSNLEQGLIEKEDYIKALLSLNTDAIKMAPDFARAEQKMAILSEQRVYKMQLLTKDILVKQAQYESEVQRKLLLTRQTLGFDDNTIIKYAEVTNETIGMIQSGGNEAPQTLWGQQATAMGRIDAIAHRA